LRDLEDSKPELLVDTIGSDIYPDQEFALDQFPLVYDYVKANFHRVTRVNQVEIWQRNPSCPRE